MDRVRVPGGFVGEKQAFLREDVKEDRAPRRFSGIDIFLTARSLQGGKCAYTGRIRMFAYRSSLSFKSLKLRMHRYRHPRSANFEKRLLESGPRKARLPAAIEDER